MKKRVIDIRKLAVFLLAGTLLAAGIPVYAAGQAESADAAENAAVNSPADEDEETDAEAVQEDGVWKLRDVILDGDSYGQALEQIGT